MMPNFLFIISHRAEKIIFFKVYKDMYYMVIIVNVFFCKKRTNLAEPFILLLLWN